MPYRLVLAESNVPSRKELRRFVEESSELMVSGEADDCAGLLESLASLSPDLILIDLFAPKLGGVQTILQIKKSCPEAKILVLTMYEEAAYMSGTLAAGADGYLLKENVFEELPTAIASIQKGRKCVSPALDRRAPKIQPEAMREPERRMVPWNHMKMVSQGNCA
jgi:DNA-binding NarL/FixJ family response regulator